MNRCKNCKNFSKIANDYGSCKLNTQWSVSTRYYCSFFKERQKAVLLSIKPKYCELIASGKKTIEVRKTKPKLETPFKVYIYETKGYDTLFGKDKPKKLCVSGGKVIGEFVCDKIDRIAHCGTCNNDIRLRVVDEKICYKELDYAYLDNCKLSYTDIDRYSNGCDVYGWHISDLIIYDTPKELSEFNKQTPPQSWCYVEEI